MIVTYLDQCPTNIFSYSNVNKRNMYVKCGYSHIMNIVGRKQSNNGGIRELNNVENK